ncbi:hypothetical protein LDENG_00099450 [Lucifuga dentata]|nr:hypothetical protein LDENG_00099450 [Lucifuga dentata]
MHEEKMEELRKSLNFMSDEIGKMTKQQTQLLGLAEEVRELKLLVKEKDRRTEALERRVDELELYSRKEDILISGLETKHRSYARATAGNFTREDAPPGEMISPEQQVIQFLHVYP